MYRGKGLLILILEEMVNESFGDGKSLERKKNPNKHIMEILLHILVQLWKSLLGIVDDILKRLEKQLDKFTSEGGVSTSSS